jgi:hypothetical protein
MRVEVESKKVCDGVCEEAPHRSAEMPRHFSPRILLISTIEASGFSARTLSRLLLQ